MSEDSSVGMVAASALLGAVATIAQELSASGVLNGEWLEQRLEGFLSQDAVQNASENDRKIIERIVKTIISGITYGTQERERDERASGQ